MSELIRQHAQQLQNRLGKLPGEDEQVEKKSKSIAEKEQEEVSHKLQTHEKIATLRMFVDTEAIDKQAKLAMQTLQKETIDARGNYASVGLNSIMNVYYLRAQRDRLLAIQGIHKFQQENDKRVVTDVFLANGMPLAQKSLFERYQALQTIDARMVAYRRDFAHIQRHAHIALNAHDLVTEKMGGKTILEHIQDPALIESLEAQSKAGGYPGMYANRRLAALRSLQKSIPSNTTLLEQNVKNTDEKTALLQSLLLLQQLETVEGSDNADIVALRKQISAAHPTLRDLTPGTQSYKNEIASIGDSLMGEIRTLVQQSVAAVGAQGENLQMKVGDALMSDMHQAITIVAFQKMQDSATGFDSWLPRFQRALNGEMIMQTERATFAGLMLANDLSTGAMHIGSLPYRDVPYTITPQQLVEHQPNPGAQTLLASQWELYRNMLQEYSGSISQIVNRPAQGPILGAWTAWLWNDRGSGLGQAVVDTVGGAVPRTARGISWAAPRMGLAPIRIPWQMLTGNSPTWLSSRIERAEQSFNAQNKNLATVDDAFEDFKKRNSARLGLVDANMKMISLLHENASPENLRLLGRSPESPFAPEPPGGTFSLLKQNFAKGWQDYQKLLKAYEAAGKTGTATQAQAEELVKAYKTTMKTYIDGLINVYHAQLRQLGGDPKNPEKLLQQIAKTPREALEKNRAAHEQLFRVQSLLAGMYVWTLQDMRTSIIPGMMEGNTGLMQDVGHVAATNTAETHIMADIIQGGGITTGLYMLGRLGRMQSTAQAGFGLARVPYLRTLTWGGPQSIPLLGRMGLTGKFLDTTVSGISRFFITASNPLAVGNGLMMPVASTVEAIRMRNAATNIMRIAGSALSDVEKAAQVLEALRELSPADKLRVWNSALSRSGNTLRGATLTRVINAELYKAAETGVNRLLLANRVVGGTVNMTRPFAAGQNLVQLLDATHNAGAARLGPLYESLRVKVLARAPIAEIRAIEAQINQVLKNQIQMLTKAGVGAEHASLLVRSGVCGSAEQVEAFMARETIRGGALAGAGGRLLRASPLIVLEGYFLYEGVQRLQEERKQRDDLIQQVGKQLAVVDFVKENNNFVRYKPGKPHTPENILCRIAIEDLTAARDGRVNSAGINVAASTASLLLTAGGAIAGSGGPAGWVIGGTVALIGLTAYVASDATEWNTAYTQMANTQGVPSWLFVLLGGAQTLTGRTGIELLHGPNWLSGIFTKEATPEARNRMLFAAVMEHMKPEDRGLMQTVASMGQNDALTGIDSLYPAFVETGRPYFCLNSFNELGRSGGGQGITWQEANNIYIPRPNWVFHDPDHVAIRNIAERTGQFFLSHVLEQHYVRLHALSQANPQNTELRWNVERLGKMQIFGRPLSDVVNPQGIQILTKIQSETVPAGTTRAAQIMNSVTQQVMKATLTRQAAAFTGTDGSSATGEGSRTVRIPAEYGGNPWLLVTEKQSAEYKKNIADVAENNRRTYETGGKILLDPPSRPRFQPFTINVPGVPGSFNILNTGFANPNIGSPLESTDPNPFQLLQLLRTTDDQPGIVPVELTGDQAREKISDESAGIALDAWNKDKSLSLVGYRGIGTRNNVPIFSSDSLPYAQALMPQLTNDLPAEPALQGREKNVRINSLSLHDMGSVGGRGLSVQMIHYAMLDGNGNTVRNVTLARTWQMQEEQPQWQHAFPWRELTGQNAKEAVSMQNELFREEKIDTSSPGSEVSERQKSAAESIFQALGVRSQNGVFSMENMSFRWSDSAKKWEMSQGGEAYAPASTLVQGGTEVRAAATMLARVNGGDIRSVEKTAESISIGRALLAQAGAVESTAAGTKIYSLRQGPGPYLVPFSARINPEGQWEVKMSTIGEQDVVQNSTNASAEWHAAGAALRADVISVPDSVRPTVRYFRNQVNMLSSGLAAANKGSMTLLQSLSEETPETRLLESQYQYLRGVLGATVSGDASTGEIFTVTTTWQMQPQSLRFKNSPQGWQVQVGTSTTWESIASVNLLSRFPMSSNEMEEKRNLLAKWDEALRSLQGATASAMEMSMVVDSLEVMQTLRSRAGGLKSQFYEFVGGGAMAQAENELSSIQKIIADQPESVRPQLWARLHDYYSGAELGSREGRFQLRRVEGTSVIITYQTHQNTRNELVASPTGIEIRRNVPNAPNAAPPGQPAFWQDVSPEIGKQYTALLNSVIETVRSGSGSLESRLSTAQKALSELVKAINDQPEPVRQKLWITLRQRIYSQPFATSYHTNAGHFDIITSGSTEQVHLELRLDQRSNSIEIHQRPGRPRPPSAPASSIQENNTDEENNDVNPLPYGGRNSR